MIGVVGGRWSLVGQDEGEKLLISLDGKLSDVSKKLDQVKQECLSADKGVFQKLQHSEVRERGLHTYMHTCWCAWQDFDGMEIWQDLNLPHAEAVLKLCQQDLRDVRGRVGKVSLLSAQSEAAKQVWCGVIGGWRLAGLCDWRLAVGGLLID